MIVDKDSILKGVLESLKVLDIEPATTGNSWNISTCEFDGCERTAVVQIETPYERYASFTYTVSCEFHVGFMTMKMGMKHIEREFDKVYCKVCERSAYTCEHSLEEMRTGTEERSDDNISYNTCRICLCDMSEHNWEAHTAEMRASSDF